jgi:hypothetical protein
MKKILDLVFTAIMGLLFIPTILIMISWNSIPGDPLYNLKRSLEDITLSITKKMSIGSSLSINYTARRFSEANRLLAKDGSTLGYQYLIEGTEVSKQIILDQKDTEKGTELVKKIEEYQTSIEERKIVIQTEPTATLPPQTAGPTVSTPIPTEQPSINVPTTTPVSSTQPVAETQITSANKTQVIEDLNQTNIKLEEIKNEIKKELPENNKGGKSSDSNDKNNENTNKGQGQHDNNNP